MHANRLRLTVMPKLLCFAIFFGTPAFCFSGELEKMKADAEGGNIYQQFNLGQEYMRGRLGPKDPVEAAKWFRKAADQGFPMAEVRLGDLFKEGTGVTRDWKEAARWYTRAADRGVPVAQICLAQMFLQGNEHFASNPPKGAAILQQLSERGVAYAQYELAVWHERGSGVPKNIVEAYKWFNLASAQGLNEAGVERDRIEKAMSPEQVAEAQKRSMEFRPVSDPKQNTPTPAAGR